MMTLYGVPGWGSAIAEVMLTMAKIPYRFVDVDGFDRPGPQNDSLAALNPLCQVPTVKMTDGSIMTETAAIALMILDECPALAPPVDTPQRRQFQRLLAWFVANVYPTFTYADYPERWTEKGADELKANCLAYRNSLYQWLESQLNLTPYSFGEQLTLFDAYLVVIYHWGPREAWFQTHTPKLYAIAQNVGERPELQEVLARNGYTRSTNG